MESDLKSESVQAFSSESRCQELGAMASSASVNSENMVKATMKFVIVFPRRSDKEFLLSASMIEAGKKTAPSSKADHYFHIDYIPFPDSDPYRIDCITYGLGAKVTHMCGTNYLYDEIVQVHTYQDVSWVVLNRVHFLDTSADEKLESIFSHKIDIRLCDDKAAVSNRSKYDKPKGFRASAFSCSDPEANAHWWSQIVIDTAANHEEVPKAETENEATAIKAKGISDKVEKLKTKITNRVERYSDANFDMSEFYFDATHVTNYSDMAGRTEANLVAPSWLNFSAKLELDRKILNDEQEKRYNPMLISLGELGPMPESPISPNELSKICKPVMINFEAFGQKFTSKKMVHADRLSFNQNYVILTGRIPEHKVVETFRKGRLKFEIHDRDRKKLAQSPSLFGQNKADQLWGRLNQTKLLESIAKTKSKANAYGVAALSMVEFANGLRYLEATLPVLPVDETIGHDQSKTIQAGHYLDSQTELSIKVKLKYPYYATSLQNAPPETGVYGVIIILASESGAVFINRVKDLLIEINEALEDPQGSDLAASGFHIHCGEQHFLTVEGPINSVINRVWEIERPDDCDTRILYSSSLLFSKRQYPQMDSKFSRLRLNFSLEVLLRNGIVHCQSFMPKVVLSAFTKLSSYSQINSIEKLYATDMILTEIEVKSLRKDFETLFSPTGGGTFENIMEVALHAATNNRKYPSKNRKSTLKKLQTSLQTG